MDNKKIEKIIHDLLIELGEDPSREGLKETPKRVSKMLKEFFKHDYQNTEELVKIFSEPTLQNGIIEIKNIPFCSLCEHHMLPFMGTANIKYIPKNSSVIGLSKFARIVNHFSKGLQIQERITNNVANFIFSKLGAKGVEVKLKAEHLCMTLRGAKSLGSYTETTCTLGNLNL